MTQAMHPSDRPIGVLDSGMGGLSILREIRRLLPAEDTIYFADTGHCPYGPRPAAEVRSLSRSISHLLIQRNAKLIVVACNTASVAALADLRATFDIPFVGIVPAVKPAAARSRRRKIGVLATAGTLRGQLFDELVSRFAAGVEVLRMPAPGMVELVERGVLDGPEAEAVVRSYVQPLLEGGADTLVLGCTHFPFLGLVVARLAGPDVEILDTGEPVARQVARVLAQHGLLRPAGSPGTLTLLTSGPLDHFRRLAPLLLGESADEVGQIDLPDPAQVCFHRTPQLSAMAVPSLEPAST